MTGAHCWLPYARLFGSGFSCINKTKLSSVKSQFLGCVRSEEGTTGFTFAKTRRYMERARPYLSWLENLLELDEEYEHDGTTTSDMSYIKEELETCKFTVLDSDMHALERGGLGLRSRKWVTTLDIPPTISKAAKVEEKFLEILSCLRLPAGDIETCFMEEEFISMMTERLPHGAFRPPPSKQQKCDLTWKTTQQKVCRPLSSRHWQRCESERRSW